ncbi:hypothetical protein Btus_3020 [Kyrpidia tusciae DSM 2912]|uniref:NYN domain-containing protein n=1 Tax=Kyrpidia tusciae (strain DSM 2912 / NBRC 15312 / T2) TaxID=562970 RepID=D5WVV1_KYRT2|nr:hypothetical protein Btus_3020 [Kyrpidia tusciae DSM 2912]
MVERNSLAWVHWEQLGEIVHRGVGKELDFDQLSRVIKEICSLQGHWCGTLAYGDFDRGDYGLQTRLLQVGIQPRHVAAREAGELHRDAVALELSLDALESVHTLPHITDHLFVGGDISWVPLFRRLTQHGKHIHLCGFQSYTHRALREWAETFTALDHREEITRDRIREAGPQISEGDLEQVIHVLAGMQERLPFVGFGLLQRELTRRYPYRFGFEDILNAAKNEGILEVYKVPNPNNPDFPTTAVRLNREHPLVRETLGAEALNTLEELRGFEEGTESPDEDYMDADPGEFDQRDD